MKISLSIKQLCLLTIVIFVVAILIIASVNALFAYAKTGADWISALIQALGNVAGGIIGGIVAYIVAAFQIQKQNEQTHKDRMNATIDRLKLIKHELVDNKAVITSTIADNTDDGLELLAQISDDIWKSSLGFLKITDDLLLKLEVIYRKLSLIKNLKDKEENRLFLNDVIEKTQTSILCVQREIERIEKLVA